VYGFPWLMQVGSPSTTTPPQAARLLTKSQSPGDNLGLLF
jgi:hypothetical protein